MLMCMHMCMYMYMYMYMYILHERKNKEEKCWIHV